MSNELDETAKCFIQDLVRFQDRQFAKDPIKAKAKKRYVVGLREIKKFLQVRKISILLLAPDVEPVKVKGGLDDVITELISLAKENEVKFSSFVISYAWKKSNDLWYSRYLMSLLWTVGSWAKLATEKFQSVALEFSITKAPMNILKKFKSFYKLCAPIMQINCQMLLQISCNKNCYIVLISNIFALSSKVFFNAWVIMK